MTTRKSATPAAKKAAPTKEKENPVSETPETSNDTTMQKARSAAVSRLREEYRTRYNELLVEEAQKLGIEWKPRPSKEEKDRAKLAELLAANPHLREELLAEQG